MSLTNTSLNPRFRNEIENSNGHNDIAQQQPRLDPVLVRRIQAVLVDLNLRTHDLTKFEYIDSQHLNVIRNYSDLSYSEETGWKDLIILVLDK